MSDYIPEDIQLNIMKLLPVKTLLRSRCVCKWWKQVIDSQSFIEEHLAIQKPNLILQYESAEYLVADLQKLPSFDVLPLPRPEQLFLLGTLHGIICLYDSNWHEIMLWNPWTHKLKTVEPISQEFNWYDYNEYAFTLGPSSGFWIDPCTKEFKIIMLQLCSDAVQDNVCEMYLSVVGEWKKIPVADELAYHYTEELVPALVIGGVGHWTVYYDYREPNGTVMLSIVVLLFDFVQEVFLESIGAPAIFKGSNRPVLCTRDGVLSLVYMDAAISFNVFSRKEGNWVNVHSFFVFPVLEKYLWWEEEVEDRERKTRVLAAITGGLLSFKSQNMLICSPLMMHIREANDVFIANGFVPSLVFPD